MREIDRVDDVFSSHVRLEQEVMQASHLGGIIPWEEAEFSNLSRAHAYVSARIVLIRSLVGHDLPVPVNSRVLPTD